MELEPKFGQFYKTSLLTTAQLLPDFIGARTKTWSNYTEDKAYILQHCYSKAPVELEPKFGQFYKTSLLTTAQLLPDFIGARTKTWSNYTQDKAYVHQHSYSQTSLELESKFGKIINKTKPTYYSTATPRLQWS